MAEIRNYTMNFSYGRAHKDHGGLTCCRKLASSEIHRERAVVGMVQE